MGNSNKAEFALMTIQFIPVMLTEPSLNSPADLVPAEIAIGGRSQNPPHAPPVRFIFSSNSHEQPSFATIGPNSLAALSPEATAILTHRPFVILISRSPGSDHSVIANNLLEDLVPKESSEHFFSGDA
jgi:hypothetical protein